MKKKDCLLHNRRRGDFLEVTGAQPLPHSTHPDTVATTAGYSAPLLSRERWAELQTQQHETLPCVCTMRLFHNRVWWRLDIKQPPLQAM